MSRPDRRLPEPPLLVITDRHQATPRSVEAAVAGALDGGARWISLREKDLPAPERLDLLRRLREVAASHGAALFVHEDVTAAAALSLDGVHLPAGADPEAARRRLGDGAVIGVSTHSVAEAVDAAARGADYVTLSPIFATESKPGYGPALGLAALSEARRAVRCPVVALGGVGEAEAATCLRAGARGVAVMGPIMRDVDPASRTRRYIAAMRCGIAE